MRTLFIYLFLMITAACNAQTNVSINQLNGTSWIMTSPPDEDIVEKDYFNNCSYTRISEYISVGKAVNTFKYYLSPTVPASFDFSKVGTKTSGKYLIGYNSKMKKMFYYEITSFDSKKMVLLRKGNPLSIGGGEDLYMTYQRIK